MSEGSVDSLPPIEEPESEYEDDLPPLDEEDPTEIEAPDLSAPNVEEVKAGVQIPVNEADDVQAAQKQRTSRNYNEQKAESR